MVLNLTPDHLERHKTMLSYAATKCRLFSHMTNARLGLLPFGMLFSDTASGSNPCLSYFPSTHSIGLNCEPVIL